MYNICFLNHFSLGHIHLFFYTTDTPLGVFHGGMNRQLYRQIAMALSALFWMI